MKLMVIFWSLFVVTYSAYISESHASSASAFAEVDDVPVLDRTKVSLDIGNLLNTANYIRLEKISTIIGSVIMNVAKRIESILEFFKPFFWGRFAIQGLPSDRIKYRNNEGKN